MFSRKSYATSNKKALFVMVAVLVFGYVFVYLSTHRLLNVVGLENEEKTIVVEMENGGNHTFTLKNNKKTLWLKKGEYRIDVSADQKFSSYSKSLKFFSTNRVEIEVKPQKSSTKLGVSRFDCALDQQKNSSVLFYPCTDYSGISHSLSANGDLLVNIDSGVGHEHDSENVSARSNFGRSLKPYNNNFLIATSDHEGLSITPKLKSGQGAGNASVKVKDFQDQIIDNTFSASNNTSSKSFAILDRSKSELLIFKNSQDDAPSRVDLSKQLEGFSETRIEFVSISKNFVFITTSQNPEELDDHEGPAHDEGQSLLAEAKIVVVDINQQKNIKTFDLSKEQIIVSSAANPSDKLLALPLYKTGDLIMVSNKKLKTLKLPWEDVKDYCWKDDSSFYYSRTTDSQIYLHSLDKEASFLVYSNPFASVDSINCSFNKLSFTLSSDGDGVVGEDFVHYSLTDQGIDKGRIEWALPMLLAVGEDSIRISQEKDSLVVNPLFIGPAGLRPSNQEVGDKILTEFRKQGIEPGNINIKFNY